MGRVYVKRGLVRSMEDLLVPRNQSVRKRVQLPQMHQGQLLIIWPCQIRSEHHRQIIRVHQIIVAVLGHLQYTPCDTVTQMYRTSVRNSITALSVRRLYSGSPSTNSRDLATASALFSAVSSQVHYYSL